MADPLVGGFKPERFLFFSGVDLWRNGQAGYAGMLLAPQGGLNNDGFLVHLFMSDDFERYDAPGQHFTTNIFRASVLPGWRVRRGDVEIKIFAGPAVESHALKPDVPTDKLRGSHFGARIATELWWEPVPAMMVAAAASATTIGSEYNARAAAGWRFLDRFWIGPEVCASTDEYSPNIGSARTSPASRPDRWNGRSAPASLRTVSIAAASTVASACCPGVEVSESRDAFSSR